MGLGARLKYTRWTANNTNAYLSACFLVYPYGGLPTLIFHFPLGHMGQSFTECYLLRLFALSFHEPILLVYSTLRLPAQVSQLQKCVWLKARRYGSSFLTAKLICHRAPIDETGLADSTRVKGEVEPRHRSAFHREKAETVSFLLGKV